VLQYLEGIFPEARGTSSRSVNHFGKSLCPPFARGQTNLWNATRGRMKQGKQSGGMEISSISMFYVPPSERFSFFPRLYFLINFANFHVFRCVNQPAFLSDATFFFFIMAGKLACRRGFRQFG
jgi:hypothetical protein